MAHISVTDDDVTEIVTLTLQLTKAMRAELRKHHLPVTMEVARVISESITGSLIAQKFGRVPSNHLH